MPESILPHVRPCIKCGSTNRYKSGDCKQCQSIRSAARYQEKREYALAKAVEYREKNKEKIKESQAAYRQKNSEKIKARNSAYRATIDRVKLKSYQADYYQKNRDAILVASKAYKIANPLVQVEYRQKNKAMLKMRIDAWRMANPEKMAKSASAWAKAHPDARRVNENNRRAKIQTTGTLSAGLPEKLFKLQKGRCACCGLSLGENYHLDHIMPLALGGTNTDNNIQLLRAKCNQQKHAKHPVAFMQERGLLL